MDTDLQPAKGREFQPVSSERFVLMIAVKKTLISVLQQRPQRSELDAPGAHLQFDLVSAGGPIGEGQLTVLNRTPAVVVLAKLHS